MYASSYLLTYRFSCFAIFSSLSLGAILTLKLSRSDLVVSLRVVQFSTKFCHTQL